MMSFERAAEAKGLEKGREEGLIEGIKSAIELGLELKFGAEGLKLVSEFTKSTDIDTLNRIKADLRSNYTLEELKARHTSDNDI